MYSNAGQDVVNPLLYPGFIEELVEVLQLDDQRLVVGGTQWLRDAFARGQFFKYRKFKRLHSGL